MRAKILKIKRLSKWHKLIHLFCINDWSVTVDYEGEIKTFESFTKNSSRPGAIDEAFLYMDIQENAPSRKDLKKLEGVEIDTEMYNFEGGEILEEIVNEEVKLTN